MTIISIGNCSANNPMPLAESIAVDFCVSKKANFDYIGQWKGFRSKELDYLYNAAKKGVKFKDFRGPGGNIDPDDAACYFAFCSLSLEFMDDPEYKKIEQAIKKLAKKDKEFRYELHKDRIIGMLAMVSARVRPEEDKRMFDEKLKPIFDRVGK